MSGNLKLKMPYNYRLGISNDKKQPLEKSCSFLIADAEVFIDFLVLEVQLNMLQQGVLTTSLNVLNENKLSNLQRTKLVQLDIQVLPRLR